MSGWQFFTRYEMWSDRLSLFARLIDGQGKRLIVAPLTFNEVAEGEAYDTPTMGGSDAFSGGDGARGFLQAAMDAAWDLGLRPKGYADVKNEISAVRYHLEDMRKLAKVTS